VALKKDPALKNARFAIIYDFIGLDATSKNPMERAGVYVWNKLWSKGYKKPEAFVDLTLFVGEPEDIPDRSLGLFLPNRRVWARYRGLKYAGYILPFDPAVYADKAAVKARLGYGPDPLIVCSIGGTSVGKELLELCGSIPILQKDIPNLRMILVCGPRLNPGTLAAPAGVEVKGYVPKLYEHFAASDLTIIQGGGTATLELTALRRPFLYFPLANHCEQQVTVAGRLARQGAGIKMTYSKTTPESLARAMASNIGKEATWPPIPSDGARKAAQFLADLLDRSG
jgi:predicted glycosyltransferase